MEKDLEETVVSFAFEIDRQRALHDACSGTESLRSPRHRAPPLHTGRALEPLFELSYEEALGLTARAFLRADDPRTEDLRIVHDDETSRRHVPVELGDRRMQRAFLR